tara:strand:+ start:6905 stop:9487 length:2583 start_codon:yes stop_codon:yes gene_type:complete
MITFTRISADRPINKRIERSPDGTLQKRPGIVPGGAQQFRVKLPLDQVSNYLNSLAPCDVLVYGVAPEGSPANIITADDAKLGRAGTPRTRAVFDWPAGPGLLMLDNDPPDDGEPLQMAQLLATLYTACPLLGVAAHWWRPSGGSCIYNTAGGAELSGIRGQRVLVAVADASDISRAGGVLAKRLWLNGHGYIKLSRRGGMLERCPIDAAVWQPERVDYIGGADCGPGLEQRRPDTLGLGSTAGLLDTREALPDLTADEEFRYQALVEKAKAAMQSRADAQREVWISEEAERRGIPESVAREAAATGDGGMLPDGYVLPFPDGYVTVAEARANREKYNGAKLPDPYEPDYHGSDPTVAHILFRDNGEVTLRSLAHGGYTVSLGRWVDTAAAFRASASGAALPQPDALTNQLVDVALRHPNEANLMLAFSALHQGQYAYLYGLGRWHQWDGTRWREDAAGTVFEAIRVMMQRFNHQDKASLAKFSLVQTIERSARTSAPLARNPADFDADPYLINTPAGTIDLRSGDMRPHTPADCITKITGYSLGGSDGSRFRQFLGEITVGDTELAAFLQRSLGACLSGAVEEHWLQFWIGEGRNGKNTLGDLVADVMGDYSKHIPASTLMSQQSPPHPTEIMNLRGARLCISSEVEEGSRWAESKIKELTGDAVLKGHYMRCDWVEFPRTHKHLIYGNHAPRLSNVDMAIRSRLKIVPFKGDFSGDRADGDLPSKLRVEGGAVLSWLIEGHRQWLAAGKRVGSCAAVDAESERYFSAQATPDMWLAERCEVIGDDGRADSGWPKVSELYSDYRIWKERRGENAMSQQRFTEWLGRHAERKRSRTGTVYVGVVFLMPLPDNVTQGVFRQ